VNNPHGAVLNGIAWDSTGKKMFITGKLWPLLFELQVEP
jgi:glutamine cyclotransferase